STFRGTATSTLLRNTGGTFRAENLDPGIKNSATDLRVADLDGDGRPEILIAERGSSSPPRTARVAVIRMHDGAPSTDFVLEAPGIDETYIATGDFEGDGRQELIMTKAEGMADLVAFTPEPHVIGHVPLPD